MPLIFRIFLLFAAALVLFCSDLLVSSTFFSNRMAVLAAKSLENPDANVTGLLASYQLYRAGEILAVVAWLVLAYFLIRPEVRTRWRKFRSKDRSWRLLPISVVLVLPCLFLTGCIRPYDVPEFMEIAPNETAFTIPLDEQNLGGQARFSSIEYIESRKVPTKRVLIPHRWIQTGYYPWDGHYVQTLKLVTVSRTPVVREWTSSEKSGTDPRNQVIYVESKDSANLSVGVSVVGRVTEEGAARFLYYYPNGSLAMVIDGEARARVQQAVARVCAKYALDDLRNHKQEITDASLNDLVDFYGKRGVEISALSLVGGLNYENTEIQRSIDQTIIAQQQRVVRQAEFEAQAKENERLLLAADAKAKVAQREAEGQAEAIRTVNAALANASPVFIQLRALDVQRDLIGRWNGAYPNVFLGGSGSGGPAMLLQVPTTPASLPAPVGPPTAAAPTEPAR
ncbi:MAG TPA: SPFH domain-containing protein [Chthoniobacterales bacterium]